MASWIGYPVSWSSYESRQLVSLLKWCNWAFIICAGVLFVFCSLFTEFNIYSTHLGYLCFWFSVHQATFEFNVPKCRYSESRFEFDGQNEECIATYIQLHGAVMDINDFSIK